MEIRKLHPVLGAEAIGVDLANLSDADFDAVKRGFETHSVLVIRDQQNLKPEDHIAFSRRFGTLEIHVLRQFLLADHPEILLVSNEKRDGKHIGLADAGRYWHSDLSYKPEPSLGSALHAKVLPRDGGDTLFASMHAAYERLPAELRAKLDPLSAEHDYAYRMQAQRTGTDAVRPPLTQAQRDEVPTVVHPVVRIHDATGRPALFVNEGFTTRILGIPEAESEAILHQLFAASTDPEIIYRHVWREGDLVMWDNRAVIHLAAGCPPEQARTMYRTTIRGEVPVGPARAGVAAASA